MTKTTISVQIDDKVKKELEKRAKKEMLELDEVISEILRRSVISSKKNVATDNIDDKFLSYFTRKQKVDYMKKIKDKFTRNDNAKTPLYERRFG